MIVRLVILALAALVAACSPGIGDSCSTNTDCGSDRTCDKSQPGGYCTVGSCVRVGCPGDAVCVEYQSQVSYCMQRCGPFEFCRSGYTCVEGVPREDENGQPIRDANGVALVYPGFCNQVAWSPDATTPTDAVSDAPAGG